MSCPHSTAFGSSPSTCSQCIIGTQVKKIAYDADTRQLLVNGEPADRPSDIENRTPPNHGHVASGRRQKTCGLCGTAGHNRQSCNRQESKNEGTEAMVRDNDQ